MKILVQFSHGTDTGVAFGPVNACDVRIVHDCVLIAGHTVARLVDNWWRFVNDGLWIVSAHPEVARLDEQWSTVAIHAAEDTP